MAWIELNATNPAPPAGAQNVHFREDTSHLGTDTDPTPVSAYIPPVVGDSGSGGKSGIVPAPAAGDAAAGKFLHASGAFEKLPVATASAPGIVEPDGSTITVDSTGKISVAASPMTAPVEIDTGGINTVGLIVKGAAASFATPTLVQSQARSTGTTSGGTLIFGRNITAGNAIILVVSQQSGASNPTITDSLGNTYQQVVKDTAQGWAAIYIATGSAGGANTITMSGGQFPDWVAFEYSGLASSPVDVATTADGSSLNSTQPAGSIVTAQSDLIIAALTVNNTSPIISATASGFTDLLSMGAAFSESQPAAQVGPAGTYSLTWINNMAINSWNSLLVGFKAASAATQVSDLAEFKDHSGNVLSAVNAKGQMVLPLTSGAPTNTPSSGACAFDPATNKLWIYGTSAWKSVTLS